MSQRPIGKGRAGLVYETRRFQSSHASVHKTQKMRTCLPNQPICDSQERDQTSSIIDVCVDIFFPQVCFRQLHSISEGGAIRPHCTGLFRELRHRGVLPTSEHHDSRSESHAIPNAVLASDHMRSEAARTTLIKPKRSKNSTKPARTLPASAVEW